MPEKHNSDHLAHHLKHRAKRRRRIGIGLFVLILLLVLAAPSFVPGGKKIVSIPDGASLGSIALILENNGIIRSATEFKYLARLEASSGSLKSGDYLFVGWNTLPEVLSRLNHADFQIPELLVTIPEGLSNASIARMLIERLPEITESSFSAAAKPYEGFLFPDTYSFYKTATSGDVVLRLRANFNRKIEPLQSKINSSRKSLRDIITMASIIEKEAAKAADRRMISDILWRRISLGMPLQVDAVFPYIFDRKVQKVYLSDLQVESPYNTYRHKGLPPGPINNPGIDAIEAAISPTKNSYLYYLSDSSGVMHYARDFEEHKRNKELYLR